MKDNKKVMYLSLPISGLDIAQVKQRAKELKEYLQDKNPEYAVYTPFDVVDGGGKPYSYYMGQYIEFMIEDADMVCFASDYNSSRGCKLEFATANIYKISHFIFGENKIFGTDYSNDGKENAEKTFSESEKKDRIIKKLTERCPFVNSSNLFFPSSVSGDTINVSTPSDPEIELYLDRTIESFIKGDFRFCGDE